jgi:hypothetical protein
MGYRIKALSTISGIVNKLLEMGEISSEDADKIIRYLMGKSTS